MAGGIVFFVNLWIRFVENMKSNSRYDNLLRWSTKNMTKLQESQREL